MGERLQPHGSFQSLALLSQRGALALDPFGATAPYGLTAAPPGG